MACNAAKSPLLRNTVIRTYSAQAAPSTSKSLNVQCTTLPNKLVVASADNCSPISRVSIFFRAGSRNETAENFGAAHMLRIAAGLGTKNSSQIGIVRNIQKIGANLTATVDRETVSYTLEGTCDAVGEALNLLSEVATNQVFKPWELSDSLPRLKYELAGLTPQTRTLDLIHKAAYRSGLGNSIFCPSFQVGKLSSETMQHYVAQNFTSNRAAVVGLGVDHNTMVSYAKGLNLGNGEGNHAPAKYHGGDIRMDEGGPLAHVAIATEGTSFKNPKEALAFAVLQRIIGCGPHVLWGMESRSLIYKAIGICPSTTPYAVSAFNAEYSDNGLFGVFVSAPPDVVGKVVDGSIKALTTTSITSEDVARGKNKLKVAVLSTLESGSAQVEEIGQQALFFGSTQNLSNLVAAINAVSDADVSAAAKKVASGKLSIAAVGNLHNVPYVN